MPRRRHYQEDGEGPFVTDNEEEQPLSNPDREEQRKWKATLKALKEREIRAIEALHPSLSVPGEPPVRNEPIRAIGAGVEEHGLLLNLVRRNGSELHVNVRSYDGNNAVGRSGTRAMKYALVAVHFRIFSGKRMRTKGALIEPQELRPVANELLKLADELEAEGMLDPPYPDEPSEDPSE